MEQELLQKLEIQEKQLSDIQADIKQAKRYFMISVWVTLGMFVLPLLAAIIIIPLFINSFINNLNGLL